MLTGLEETLVLNAIFESLGIYLGEVQRYVSGGESRRGDIYPYNLQDCTVIGTDKEKDATPRFVAVRSRASSFFCSNRRH